MLVKPRSIGIFLLQLLLIVVSATLAWLLRFNFAFQDMRVLVLALPVLLLVRTAAMARFNLFRGYWRYTGMNDAIDVSKAVFTGSLVFLVAERWIIGAKSFPVSVYFIEAILTACALGGVRMLSRAFRQKVQERSNQIDSKPVVVIGAGWGAAMLLLELPRRGYTACALVDDDPAKAKIKLHGVPVAGRLDDLPEIVHRYNPTELMIAIPSATREQMQRITECCQRTGLLFRTIPGLADLLDGKVTVDQLRSVNLEDLLGREPVKFDLEAVRRKIRSRVVMVTGAAGSIGSELCSQLLRYSPSKLVCVDQSETPLFNLQQANGRSEVKMAYCVADIADRSRMSDLMREHDVKVIFHAAAYKHVPLMEENLQEAVKNNVFGLLSLIEVADQSGCEDFLLISSDKAVSPTSFMGCTKRIGELIIAARPSAEMRCLSVRFGNVLGSQGSVVPLFQEQLKTSRQITITHPDITRYFMTIPEAVSLVLQAFAIGEKGDILVLDMGEPVRIVDMAETLIRLSGIARDQVKIVYIGLRPGEKLFEELFYDFEGLVSTSAKKVLRTQSHVMSWRNLQTQLNALHSECATCLPARIRSKVKEIVPQYQWSSSSVDDRIGAVKIAREPVIAHMSVALATAIGSSMAGE
jgi:FlaA1/EpsC-like NDP-sugar epimerase